MNMWHPFGKSKKLEIIEFSNKLSGVVGLPGHDGRIRWATENYHIESVLRYWHGTPSQDIWEARPLLHRSLLEDWVASDYSHFPTSWHVKLKNGVSTQILPSSEDQTLILHELIVAHNKPIVDAIMAKKQREKRQPEIVIPIITPDDDCIEDRFHILDFR